MHRLSTTQTTSSPPLPRPLPFGVSRSTSSRFPPLREAEEVRPLPATTSPTPATAASQPHRKDPTMTHADRDHSEHQQLRGSWPDYVAIALGGTTERTAIDRVTGRPATAYTPPEDVIWPADPTVTDEPAGPLAADPGQDHPVQTEGHRRGRDGRYLCCRHCVEDKIHDVPKDGHDGPCSTCDDPGAMTRERLRDAEAEVARLRAELETMGDEWEGLAGHLRRQPMNSLDRREANVWDVAVERLRGILDGPSGAQSPAETPGETTTTTGAGAI